MSEIEKQTPDVETEQTEKNWGGFKMPRHIHRFLLPALLLFAAVAVSFLPQSEIPQDGTVIRTLSVPHYPLTLVLEERNGLIVSALLRTPAGTREIEPVRGLSYLSETKFLTKADQDETDDLLWRTSFMNFEGKGVHLWIGALTWAPKVFIAATPFEYTRWDAVPAKIIVPKGTALYVAPLAPSYDSKETLQGKDAYTFVYTMRLTPEGPAFVPVPDIYSQLAVILQAGMRGELRQPRRIAYLRMLNEFERLASGEPPKLETILNLQMDKIDTLTWKK